MPEIFATTCPAETGAGLLNFATEIINNITGLWPAIILGIKTCIFCFIFV